MPQYASEHSHAQFPQPVSLEGWTVLCLSRMNVRGNNDPFFLVASGRAACNPVQVGFFRTFSVGCAWLAWPFSLCQCRQRAWPSGLLTNHCSLMIDKRTTVAGPIPRVTTLPMIHVAVYDRGVWLEQQQCGCWVHSFSNRASKFRLQDFFNTRVQHSSGLQNGPAHFP